MSNLAPTASAQKPVRIATPEELDQLWDFFVRDGIIEQYEFERSTWLGCFWIAVFDDYITGGPGYAGRLMVTVQRISEPGLAVAGRVPTLAS